MKIKNILVSQAIPQALEKSPYFQIITKYGTEIKSAPFVKLEGISLKEFRSQRIDILDHTTIIFSSRNTIDNFFRICEEARVTVPETMKYLCNSEVVALYLQKYIVFRKRKIFFANGTFPNFMELMMKHKGEKFLLVLSEPYSDELPVTMERMKLDFDRVILSRTVTQDISDIDIDKIDLVVAYSHPEVTSLLNNFGAAKMPSLATFGERTTRAALESGLRVNVMAPTPEAPSMTKAIELYLEKLNQGEEVPDVELNGERQSEKFIESHDPKRTRKSASVRK